MSSSTSVECASRLQRRGWTACTVCLEQQQRSSSNLIFSLERERNRVLDVGLVGVDQEFPAGGTNHSRKLEIDHIVIGVDDEQQSDIRALTADAGRLGAAVKQYAHRAGIRIIPIVRRHLRAN